jgi:tetratricopeptide (TPR) repeat protein
VSFPVRQFRARTGGDPPSAGAPPGRFKRGSLLETTLAFFSVLFVAFAANSVARADVVSTQGRPIAVGVQITALRDGQLTYRPPTGPQVSRPIEQVRYLQISGWETFNQAEKQQRDGQAALAIAGYEQCLEEVGSVAPAVPTVGPSSSMGSIDRRLLVQCRLARLYDLHGQFDRAVAAYLEALDRMPAVVQTLRPVRLPRTDPAMLRKAADLVDKAISRRDRLDPLAISLEKWRATWPEIGNAKEGIQGATSGSNPSTGRGLITLARAASRPANAEAAFGPLLAEVRSFMQSGKYQQALDRIEKGSAPLSAGGLLPAELYYWQGRALMGTADKAPADEAKVNRRRAGLAFMRVVIHWPENPLTAECLYRAGEVCHEESQPDRAKALWTELIQRYPTGAPWLQRARQEMARMRASASGPSK